MKTPVNKDSRIGQEANIFNRQVFRKLVLMLKIVAWFCRDGFQQGIRFNTVLPLRVEKSIIVYTNKMQIQLDDTFLHISPRDNVHLLRLERHLWGQKSNCICTLLNNTFCIVDTTLLCRIVSCCILIYIWETNQYALH